MLREETFVSALNEMKRAWDYQEGLNDYFKDNGVDGYVFQPDCSNNLLEVIEEAMGLERDENGCTCVSWFCLEADFGRKFKPGDWKVNGEDVDLSTPEALYAYIINMKDGD